MISGLPPSSEQFLANLERIQARGDKAQREISTGRRVSRPSDDPDQLGSILDTAAQLDRVERINMNLPRVKGEVDTAEMALEGAVSMLDRLRAIAAEGATSTETTQQRKTLQVEVEALMDRLVAAANVTYEGRTIFSGDADNTAPYQVDWSQANGVSAYAGRPATRKIEHPSGYWIPVAKSADEIFDAPGGNSVFAAVAALRNGLQADDQNAILAATDLLKAAHNHLSAELSFYGSVQQQVADAVDTGAKLSLRLQTTLSGLRDADLTASILALNDAKVQQDAALSAQAKMPRTTLFDFLG